MWAPEGEDPRVDGGWKNSEKGVLLGQLTDRRLTGDTIMVDEAWRVWTAEVENTDRVLADIEDLGVDARGLRMPIREIVVHLIREYAQHLGHADLLRERIDGRVGQ